MKKENLIREGNHFVPKSYYYYNNGMPQRSEHRDNFNANLPKISFDKECNMRKIKFDSPDFGGYDAITLTYYYETIEELMEDVSEDHHAKNLFSLIFSCCF